MGDLTAVKPFFAAQHIQQGGVPVKFVREMLLGLDEHPMTSSINITNKNHLVSYIDFDINHSYCIYIRIYNYIYISPINHVVSEIGVIGRPPTEF